MFKVRIKKTGIILWVTYSYERHLFVTCNGTTFKEEEIIKI